MYVNLMHVKLCDTRVNMANKEIVELRKAMKKARQAWRDNKEDLKLKKSTCACLSMCVLFMVIIIIIINYYCSYYDLSCLHDVSNSYICLLFRVQKGKETANGC